MTEHRDDIRRLLHRARKVVRRSFRYWPVYVLAIAAAVGAAFYTPKLLGPVYVSGAVLVYEELIPTSTLMGTSDAVVETPRQRGARLREMVLSRTNLETIIDDLGLYPEIIASEGRQEAVNEFLTDVDVRSGEDTFTLKFQYSDPDVAERVTARLAQSLIDQSARHRVEQARSTSSFLEQQRDNAKAELIGREEALAEFLAGHPEFAQDMMLQGPGGAAAAGASIRAQSRKQSTVVPYVEALERQRARLLKRVDSIDNPEAAAAVPPPVAAKLDPQIRRRIEVARREVDRATADLADKRARFTDKHPDVGRAQNQLATARAALEAAEGAASGAQGPAPVAMTAPPAKEGDRKALMARLRMINISLSKAKERGEPGRDVEAESTWVVDLETRWASLNRELHDVRERYQQIERRYFQASIIDSVEAAGGAGQMMVVDPAYRPERPSSRGPRRVGAAGALVALMLLGGLALSLGYFDDHLYDADDLEGLDLDGFEHVVPPYKGA